MIDDIFAGQTTSKLCWQRATHSWWVLLLVTSPLPSLLLCIVKDESTGSALNRPKPHVQAMLDSACAQYNVAATMEPNNEILYANWASAFYLFFVCGMIVSICTLIYSMYEKAKIAPMNAKQALWDDSIAKYSKLIALQQQNGTVEAHTYNNFACVYLDMLATAEDPATKSNAYTKAKHYLTLSDNLTQGMSAYNMGCLYALSGEHQQCQQWLEKALDKPKYLPSPEVIQSDQDFATVKTTPWFKSWVQKAAQREGTW